MCYRRASWPQIVSLVAMPLNSTMNRGEVFTVFQWARLKPKFAVYPPPLPKLVVHGEFVVLCGRIAPTWPPVSTRNHRDANFPSSDPAERTLLRALWPGEPGMVPCVWIDVLEALYAREAHRGGRLAITGTVLLECGLDVVYSTEYDAYVDQLGFCWTNTGFCECHDLRDPLMLSVPLVWDFYGEHHKNVHRGTETPPCAWFGHSLGVRAKLIPMAARVRVELVRASINGCSGPPPPWHGREVRPCRRLESRTQF
jgi:hypothetical protein